MDNKEYILECKACEKLDKYTIDISDFPEDGDHGFIKCNICEHPIYIVANYVVEFISEDIELSDIECNTCNKTKMVIVATGTGTKDSSSRFLYKEVECPECNHSEIIWGEKITKEYLEKRKLELQQ